MKLELYEKSIIGSRDDQQDCCASSLCTNTAFAAVCDGMGGTNGGAVASRTATERMMSMYRAKEPLEGYPDFFLRSIDVLDESIVAIQRNPGFEGAGTTIVAAAIDGSELYWLSVGDSRLYILRGSEIIQVTRDHNFALCLGQWGETELRTAKAINNSLYAEMLISFIGIGGIRIYDNNRTAFELCPGDMVLLTTDGLTKALDDREIHHILTSNSPHEGMDILFRRATAKSNKSQDNTTCVLIAVRSW